MSGHEKRPLALPGETAANAETDNSVSPPIGDFNAAAACILDAERRYLSALWNEPIDGFNAAVDAGLCGDDFTGIGHGDLYAALMAHAEHVAEHETYWRLDDVRRLVEALGIAPGAFDGRDGLAWILECESSGAGASSYARLIAFHSRKRRQARRLHRALEAIPDDVLSGDTSKPRITLPAVLICTTRRKRGAA